jgi:hypothetical protein
MGEPKDWVRRKKCAIKIWTQKVWAKKRYPGLKDDEMSTGFN